MIHILRQINMKRMALALVLGVCLIATSVFAMSTEPAYAASYKTPVKIKEGQTKSIDLDGGKKEKVSFTKKKVIRYDFYTDGSPAVFYNYIVKINGKTVATKEKNPEYGGTWSLYYVDLNKKDKYKELILECYEGGGVEPGSNYYIYRYKGGKLVSIKATYSMPTGKMFGNYTYKFKKSPCVTGNALRAYGDGTFGMKYNYDSDGAATNYKPITRWITLKIDSNMKVTRK